MVNEFLQQIDQQRITDIKKVIALCNIPFIKIQGDIFINTILENNTPVNFIFKINEFISMANKLQGLKNFSNTVNLLRTTLSSDLNPFFRDELSIITDQLLNKKLKIFLENKEGDLKSLQAEINDFIYTYK